jgi:hypothetical protein
MGVSDDSVFSPRVFARMQIPHSKFWSHQLLDHGGDFPLLSRAWVYQECLLSPRVLHFSPNELIWACQEQFDCEGSCMDKQYDTTYTGSLESLARAVTPPLKVADYGPAVFAIFTYLSEREITRVRKTKAGQLVISGL